MGMKRTTKQVLKMQIGDGVRRVVDATRDLVIDVTSADVRKGRRAKADCCAAAVAIMREEKVKAVRVHRARVYVDYGDKIVRYITPNSLRTDLVAFDLYGKFATGQHILQKVPESQRIGIYRGSNTSSRPRRKRRPQHTLFGVREKASNKPHLIGA